MATSGSVTGSCRDEDFGSLRKLPAKVAGMMKTLLPGYFSNDPLRSHSRRVPRGISAAPPEKKELLSPAKLHVCQISLTLTPDP